MQNSSKPRGQGHREKVYVPNGTTLSGPVKKRCTIVMVADEYALKKPCHPRESGDPVSAKRSRAFRLDPRFRGNDAEFLLKVVPLVCVPFFRARR